MTMKREKKKFLHLQKEKKKEMQRFSVHFHRRESWHSGFDVIHKGFSWVKFIGPVPPFWQCPFWRFVRATNMKIMIYMLFTAIEKLIISCLMTRCWCLTNRVSAIFSELIIRRNLEREKKIFLKGKKGKV